MRELERDVQRANRADQLLSDELIKQAFIDIRRIYFEKISKLKWDEIEERLDACNMIRAIEDFEAVFRRHINTGKAAEQKLTAMQKAKRILRVAES